MSSDLPDLPPFWAEPNDEDPATGAEPPPEPDLEPEPERLLAPPHLHDHAEEPEAEEILWPDLTVLDPEVHPELSHEQRIIRLEMLMERLTVMVEESSAGAGRSKGRKLDRAMPREYDEIMGFKVPGQHSRAQMAAGRRLKE